MFIHEALMAGAREGLKVGLFIFVIASLYDGQRRSSIVISALSGLAIALLCVMLNSGSTTLSMDIRLLLPRLSGYVFFLFFFAASIVLLRFPGAALGAREGRVSVRWWLLTVLMLFVFWIPDVFAVSFYLDDLIALKQNTLKVYANALSGFAITLSLGVYVSRLRVSARLSRYMGVGQLLIILSLVKLLMSGIKGLSGASLVSTVQGGVMKFVHDMVHQTFVYLLVPDHPMLKTTLWNFIGFFFGSPMSTALALLALLVPPLVYIYFSMTSPVALPTGALTGAEKRIHKTAVRASRRRLSVPVVFFIIVVILGWYSGGGDSAALYMPTPKPMIAEGGVVSIPITSPGEDLLDGRIHKYSVLLDGRSVVLLVMKKTDGKLSLTLDACEICPPDGYGQRQGYVVCTYCMTPIPVDTLGQPGGCNPVPLKFEVTETDVRVSLDEIKSKWDALIRVRGKGEDR